MDRHSPRSCLSQCAIRRARGHECARDIPAEHWRLAAAFRFSPLQIFRHLDGPVLRAELPSLAGLIFLLCFTSFAIVLSLGGGPARATLEVAIYEALKIDLDFGRAAWLAFLQVAICMSLAALLHWAVERVPLGSTLRAQVTRPDAQDRRLLIVDMAVLIACGALFGPLLLSLLPGLGFLSAVIDLDFGRALITSTAISLVAALVACVLAVSLASAARSYSLRQSLHGLAAVHDFLPATLLAVPPFALTAGLFLVLRPLVDPATAGYVLLPLINGFGALPFAYSFVRAPLMAAEERYGRLASTLGLTNWNRVAVVDWPLLRRPAAAAFAMAMALSFGDFGVVALFGGTELRTLPYLLYERLGAYRFEEASAISCLIVLISVVLAFASGRFTDAAD